MDVSLPTHRSIRTPTPPYARAVGRPRETRDWALLEREIEAINKFPGQNPNPVLRMTGSGTLIYANDSSAPIVTAWGATVGAGLPADEYQAHTNRSVRRCTPSFAPSRSSTRSKAPVSLTSS